MSAPWRCRHREHSLSLWTAVQVERQGTLPPLRTHVHSFYCFFLNVPFGGSRHWGSWPGNHGPQGFHKFRHLKKFHFHQTLPKIEGFFSYKCRHVITGPVILARVQITGIIVSYYSVAEILKYHWNLLLFENCSSYQASSWIVLSNVLMKKYIQNYIQVCFLKNILVTAYYWIFWVVFYWYLVTIYFYHVPLKAVFWKGIGDADSANRIKQLRTSSLQGMWWEGARGWKSGTQGLKSGLSNRSNNIAGTPLSFPRVRHCLGCFACVQGVESRLCEIHPLPACTFQKRRLKLRDVGTMSAATQQVSCRGEVHTQRSRSSHPPLPPHTLVIRANQPTSKCSACNVTTP